MKRSLFILAVISLLLTGSIMIAGDSIAATKQASGKSSTDIKKESVETIRPSAGNAAKESRHQTAQSLLIEKEHQTTTSFLPPQPEEIRGAASPASPLPGEKPSMQAASPPESTLQPAGKIKELVVPPGSVLMIALEQALNSDRNMPGEQINATVTEPLQLGPYLAVPKDSRIVGTITHINSGRASTGDKHPYVVVAFTALKRPEDQAYIPFSGSLIAYKNGLRGHEYVWRLPQKGDKARSNLKSVAAGAISGAFINPLFGPLLGAGAGLLKSSVMDGFARGGSIKIKARDPLPISVEEAFAVPVLVQEAALPPPPGLPAEVMQPKEPVMNEPEQQALPMESPGNSSEDALQKPE